MRLKLFVLFCLLGCLSGCQTQTDPLDTAAMPASLSGPAASAIAGDLSGRFAEQAGAPSKVIRMQGDGTPFATSLAAVLKGWGYTIATDDSKASAKGSTRPVELGYALTDVDGQVLARLSTGTMSVSRIYNVTATGATPVSPLSIMKRN